MNAGNGKSYGYYAGVLAALAASFFDVVLLGQPVSGWHYDIASFGAVEQATPLRVALGALGGMAAIFFTCFGYTGIYKRHEQYRGSQMLFWSLCGMSVFAAVFHGGYYFLPGQDTIPVFLHYTKRELCLLAVSVLSFGCALAAAQRIFVLTPPHAPWWQKWFSPLLLYVLMFGVLYLLPAPAGGYIRPAFVNLGLALFLLVTGR